MTGCRISEEDARDPYFDGEELTAEELNEAQREDFEALLEDIQEHAEGLLEDPSWVPDDDDLAAARHLYQHLNYYYIPPTATKENK